MFLIFFSQTMCLYQSWLNPNRKKRRDKNSRRRNKKPQRVDYLKVEYMVSRQVELFTGLHIYFSIQHEKKIWNIFFICWYCKFFLGKSCLFFNFFFGRARNFPYEWYYILLPWFFFFFCFFFCLSFYLQSYHNIQFKNMIC